MAELTDIRVELEAMKQELNNVNSIHTRLDTAIDKLTDVTNCLNKMIAVQEQKIEQQERDDKYLIEKLKTLDKRVM